MTASSTGLGTLAIPKLFSSMSLWGSPGGGGPRGPGDHGDPRGGGPPGPVALIAAPRAAMSFNVRGIDVDLPGHNDLSLWLLFALLFLLPEYDLRLSRLM